MRFDECLDRDHIVVQRSGAMGDVIWTTPLFKYMRDVGFRGEIVMATHHPEVFMNNTCVTRTVDPSINAFAPGHEATWNLDWSYESNRKKHMLEAYCDILGIDYSAVEKQPLLYPDAEDSQWAVTECNDQLLCSDCKKVVVIHAAATSPDRIWSCLRWEELTSRLLELGFFVICVGAAKDYHLQQRSDVLDLVGHTTLGQVIALIDSADAFIGIDSGIANVAFSTSTPSIVLYGMAKPSTRLPLGSSIHYGLSANLADCVCLGCLEKISAQEPPLCHSLQKSKCMDLISVDAVMSAFMKLH